MRLQLHNVTGKDGWWESMVGPGKVLDPAHYFIICVNVLGGCMGTTGPLACDPASGQPWNLRFPVVTVGDMVRDVRAPGTLVPEHVRIIVATTGGRVEMLPVKVGEVVKRGTTLVQLSNSDSVSS